MCLECPDYLESRSSARVPQVLECPNALTSRVPRCPSSTQVSKCPWSGIRVPLESPLNSQFPFKCSSSREVYNITRNGLVNSFIEFLKTFQNTYFKYTFFYKQYIFDPRSENCLSFSKKLS